jgi:hypothetical protein
MKIEGTVFETIVRYYKVILAAALYWLGILSALWSVVHPRYWLMIVSLTIPLLNIFLWIFLPEPPYFPSDRRRRAQMKRKADALAQDLTTSGPPTASRGVIRHE